MVVVTVCGARMRQTFTAACRPELRSITNSAGDSSLLQLVTSLAIGYTLHVTLAARCAIGPSVTNTKC